MTHLVNATQYIIGPDGYPYVRTPELEKQEGFRNATASELNDWFVRCGVDVMCETEAEAGNTEPVLIVPSAVVMLGGNAIAPQDDSQRIAPIPAPTVEG